VIAPVTPPPDREAEAEYRDERVCLSVCLSVRDHIFGTTRPTLAKFLCMLPMAVAFSGGVVTHYVLPVFLNDFIFAHKPRLLDVAAHLNRSAHAALGLAISCAQ